MSDTSQPNLNYPVSSLFKVDGIDGIDTFGGAQTVLQNVIDTIPQTVFWKDKDHFYCGCNRSFACAAGKSEPIELVGLTDFDLPWTREEAEFYRKCDREVMDSGVAQLGIIESQVNADGKQLVRSLVHHTIRLLHFAQSALLVIV